MPRAEITIKVRAREDFVPVDSFLTVVSSTLSILNEFGHISGAEAAFTWKVSAASLQSPLTLTIFSDAPNGDVIVRECIGVFEQAEQSSDLPFARWNYKTLENAKRLVSVLNDGVSQVTFSAPGIPAISPTQRVAASIDYLLAPAFEDYGSFEGTLETLSVHGRTRFNIFDPVKGRAIACYFAADKLQEAHAAFNHRVMVSGTAKYNRIGHPVSVMVENIRTLEGGVEPSEFHDINLTGGIESGRYVRGLRDG
jgi:hypothetical protein